MEDLLPLSPPFVSVHFTVGPIMIPMPRAQPPSDRRTWTGQERGI